MDPPGHARADRRIQRRHARQRPGTLSDTTAPGCARVVVADEHAELVADVLWFHGATAVGERAVGGGRVELEAGFVTPADAARAVAAVGERGVRGEVVDVGPALDAALDAWMAFARPVRVGGLHVRPSWLADDDDPPGAGERVVVLDPSRAFGSGSHPSTLACLAAITRWAPGASVLDVGCGSGVLALAAASLGAGRVVAVDVDPVAVAATSANAARNGLTVETASGSAGDVRGRFDLVVANIGAATIVELAPALADRTAPGGTLVVAGFHVSRSADVEGALTTVGLARAEERVDDRWACLIHHSPDDSAHTVRPRHERDAPSTRGAR